MCLAKSDMHYGFFADDKINNEQNEWSEKIVST